MGPQHPFPTPMEIGKFLKTGILRFCLIWLCNTSKVIAMGLSLFAMGLTLVIMGLTLVAMGLTWFAIGLILNAMGPKSLPRV